MNNIRLTTTLLQYVVVLNECRHYGKAAEKLCVSQPTLSIAIKNLEEALGAQLFERSKAAVVPTEIGAKVIRQAAVILHHAEVLELLCKPTISTPTYPY